MTRPADPPTPPPSAPSAEAEALDAMERLSEFVDAHCTGHADCPMPHREVETACVRVLALLAAARRGEADTRDAERWRFVREHYTWLRRVDDDEVEQTYLDVRVLPGTDLSCAPMVDHAIDRLAARVHPEDPTNA